MGALNTGVISTIPYFPALVPDGVFQAGLATNTPTALTSLANLPRTGKIARLRRLRMPATANIALTVTADSYSTPPVDAGAAFAATPTGAVPDPWDAGAAAQLAATVINNTGVAVNNWWASWLVQLDDPSAANTALYPGTYHAPTATQAAAAQAEHLTDPLVGGLAPRPLGWIIEQEYRSHLRRAVMLGKTIAMPAGGSPSLFLTESRSDPDEMLVLAGLMTSPGTGTDQLSLIIGLDDHNDLYTVPAYPLGQAGFIPLFLQARHKIQIQATTTTAETVGVAANIWHVQLSDLIRHRLGQSGTAAVAQAQEAGTL